MLCFEMDLLKQYFAFRDTIKLVKVYMITFNNKSKIFKKCLIVKIFGKFFRIYKKFPRPVYLLLLMPIIQIYKIHLRSTYVIGKIYPGQRKRSRMGTLRNSA